MEVQIGDGSKISQEATFDTSLGGKIVLGKNCEIFKGVIFMTYGGNIEVGDDCSFNPYCVIYGHGGLKIGRGVRIAAHTVIIPANHSFESKELYIHQQPEIRKGIIIEDDVWIGAGSKILDDVRIAKGCVIAAGTVLTKSTLAYGMYAGVPGKFIKSR